MPLDTASPSGQPKFSVLHIATTKPRYVVQAAFRLLRLDWHQAAWWPNTLRTGRSGIVGETDVESIRTAARSCSPHSEFGKASSPSLECLRRDGRGWRVAVSAPLFYLIHIAGSLQKEPVS